MPRTRYPLPTILVLTIERMAEKYPEIPLPRLIEAVCLDMHNQAKLDPDCEKVLSAQKAGVTLTPRESTWRVKR